MGLMNVEAMAHSARAKTDVLGSPALRKLLVELLGNGDDVRLHSQHRLNSRVHRLCFDGVGTLGSRSLIVKRLTPEVARRNAMVVKRWLPAIDFAQHGPVLLAMTGEATGEHIWHVYEDHGPWGLAGAELDPDRVEAALEIIAELHLRFAEHPLLGECRIWGGDHGMHFYASSVRDALRAVAALKPPNVDVSRDHATLRDRLLARLRSYLADLSRRADLLASWGGPETLLHGDLWTKNIFVEPSRDGTLVRLIDWDHASIGPVSYDLSTFLYRFAPAQRAGILDTYQRFVSRLGWRLAPPVIWNDLAETAEIARIACRVVCPAIAVLDGNGAWGWDDLAKVDGWFEGYEPVFALA